MAISMKEKEKNLLIQSFEYGEDRGDEMMESNFAGGQMVKTSTSTHNVFATLNDEKTIHSDI